MPWPGWEQKCRRTLERHIGAREAGWPCYGRLRTLYVRAIVEGEPKGWQAVGTFCLRCHAVDLEEDRLPPQGWR